MNETLKDYFQALDLDPNKVLLFLLSCRFNLNYDIDEKTFSILVNKNIIKRDYINERTIVCIPLFVGEEGETELTFKTIDFDVNRYRKLFKGIRIGAMGNPNTCLENLKKFLTLNEDYSFEDVLDATQYYVENTNPQYVSNADNFIYGEDTKGNKISRLLLALEELSHTNNRSFN
jgi:hypothetical protein